MSKTERLLHNIRSFIRKAEEDEEQLIDVVPDFPGLELLPDIVEDFEAAVARLLRNQRKLFLDALKDFVSKSDADTIASFLAYLKNDLFASDEFAEQMSEEANKFLTVTTEQLCIVIMDSIDKEIAFEVFSGRTTRWLKNWSEQLGEIMKLHTHEALERELLQAIELGESIDKVEERLKDMPQFNRKRARRTARTEILTASSHANWESFMQSPAVLGKKWKHSGAKKITPRPTHVAMNGVVVGVDEEFEVDGEFGQYPRDTSFSAKNRVECGCVIGPVTDDAITMLSQEEKEAIRQEVLEELK